MQQKNEKFEHNMMKLFRDNNTIQLRAKNLNLVHL